MSNEDKEFEKAKKKKKLEVSSAAANARIDAFFSDIVKRAFYCNRGKEKITFGFDRADGTVIEVALSTAWSSVWIETFRDLAEKLIAGASFDDVKMFDCAATRIDNVVLYTRQKDVLKRCQRRIRKIRIPDGITVLSSEAFSYCYDLESVFIPKSVKDIHARSFYRCKSLATLSVDEENPYFCSVGNTLYTKARQSLIFSPPLAEPIIVDGVKRIRKNAFAYNCKLTELILPKSVEVIESQAFECCDSLCKIELNEGLKSIEMMAFNSCHLLKEVVIPSGVEVLHKSTFYLCPTLEKITLRGNTITIEPNAFSECKKYIQIVRA